MRYLTIFNKVKGGDLISVSAYSVENVLKGFPKYNNFCSEKVSLRKELEKDYKSKFVGNQSMRVYLEHVVYGITNGTPLYVSFTECFGTESPIINKVIESKIKELINKYSTLKDELTVFLWNSDNYINRAFSDVGLIPFLSKTEFKYLFMLKNGEVGLTLFFKLNDDSKEIFIKRVVDDWGNNIACFQDVAIYENGEGLFGSITHEDWYSFKDK